MKRPRLKRLAFVGLLPTRPSEKALARKLARRLLRKAEHAARDAGPLGAPGVDFLESHRRRPERLAAASGDLGPLVL